MKPISNRNKEFDEQNLKDYIIQICKEHHKAKKAHAFAFLVYDNANPNIKKILKDKDYWSSFDKIASDKLTIFYVDSQDDYYKERQTEIYKEEDRRIKQMMKQGFVGYMQPIVRKATPLDKSLNTLRKEFGIEENITSPFLLFFQTNESQVLGAFVVNIKSKKLEETYLEIKEVLDLAIYSISKLEKASHENFNEIFNLIKGGVEDGLMMKFVFGKVKENFSIENLLGLITKFYTGI